jgi:hypothetical protein
MANTLSDGDPDSGQAGRLELPVDVYGAVKEPALL